MTLLSTVTRASYVGDSVTKTFPVPFKLWSAQDLKAYIRATSSGADEPASVSVDASMLPGETSVTFADAPPLGAKITLIREMALTQELDLAASGAFEAENVERQLDVLVAEIQTLREQLARTPQLPVGASATSVALPEPSAANANRLLAISADGTGFALKVPADLSLQTVSPFAAALLDDPDPATARATLGIGTAIDLNLLTSDTSGGAAADSIAFVDASEANASNRVPVPDFLSNAITAMPVPPAIDTTAYEFLARHSADGAVHRLPLAIAGTGKQTVWIPASALTPRLTSPPVAATQELPGNKLVLKTLDFDALTNQYAQAIVQMPKGWNEGALTLAFVWSHATASLNFNTVWAARALSIADAGIADTPFSAAVQVTDTGGVAGQLYRSPETPPLLPAGTIEPGATLAIEIFRAATDPADTLQVSARLLGIAVFYVTNNASDV